MLLARSQVKAQATAAATEAATIWAANDYTNADGDRVHLELLQRRVEVQRLCREKGVKFPTVAKPEWGNYPELLRTSCDGWWGRQIMTTDRRAHEYRAMKESPFHRYCSDVVYEARQADKKRMAQMLEDIVAVSETGDFVSLREIAKGSISNPAVRRAELMCRIRGMEDYATARNMPALFFTITCPSRFHRVSNKWDGSNPKQAQAYLCATWARCRAHLAREDITPIGFRVAEPHKDGCPHWHALFWFDNGLNADRATAIITDHFLRDSGTEAGAKANRVKTKAMRTAMGGATGYIAKYICKNVDGTYDKPGEGAQTFNNKAYDPESGELRATGMDSIEAALRVEAWASCWGIRQFQQIGGPKIGVWRELRRLGDEEAPGALEALRAAANKSQFDLFIAESQKTDAGLIIETTADLIQQATATAPLTDETLLACLNKWQEPAIRRVKGLRASGAEIITRLVRWVLVARQLLQGEIDRQKRAREITARQEPAWLRSAAEVGIVAAAQRWKQYARAEARHMFNAVAFAFQRAAPPPALEHCQ